LSSADIQDQRSQLEAIAQKQAAQIEELSARILPILKSAGTSTEPTQDPAAPDTPKVVSAADVQRQLSELKAIAEKQATQIKELSARVKHGNADLRERISLIGATMTAHRKEVTHMLRSVISLV
jgi:hypothetical protein